MYDTYTILHFSMIDIFEEHSKIYEQFFLIMNFTALGNLYFILFLNKLPFISSSVKCDVLSLATKITHYDRRYNCIFYKIVHVKCSLSIFVIDVFAVSA